MRAWSWLVKGLLDEFGDRLVSIAIYGSAARGEAGEGSDLDVLVVVEGLPEDLGERLRSSGRVARKVRPPPGAPRPVSAVLLTPEEVERRPPILLDVVEDAIILYDRDGFLSRVLQRLRERLRELGARRVRTERGWYWILKPDAEFGEVAKV